VNLLAGGTSADYAVFFRFVFAHADALHVDFASRVA
jgi:hypothetical protein